MTKLLNFLNNIYQFIFRHSRADKYRIGTLTESPYSKIIFAIVSLYCDCTRRCMYFRNIAVFRVISAYILAALCFTDEQSSGIIIIIVLDFKYSSIGYKKAQFRVIPISFRNCNIKSDCAFSFFKSVASSIYLLSISPMILIRRISFIRLFPRFQDGL